MKKFLLRTLLFILLLGIYAGINYLINSYIISKQKIDLGGINTLIIGDSHTARSINPKLFASARNISQTAEPYYITFWKLQAVFENNKIDTLILGFSHHNISGFNDKKLSNRIWSSEMFRRTYAIESMDALNENIIDYQEFYKIYFKNMCLYPQKTHHNWVGSYQNFNSSSVSNSEKSIKRHFFYRKKNAGISETSINYLDSIVNFCIANNIELVLVGSPVHAEYFGRIPDNFINRYKLEKKRLRSQGIPVLDFTNHYYRDSYFLDPDHLNTKGANAHTKRILELLKNDEAN